MLDALLVLLSAHFIADFLLQPTWLLKEKNRLAGQLLHAMIVGWLSWFLLQQSGSWKLPLLLTAAHFLVDRLKRRFTDGWKLFCWDQVVHLALTFLLLQFALKHGWMTPFVGCGLSGMIGVAGFAVAVQGAGFLIERVVHQLQEENALADKIRGLKNGGKLIGLLERALIFLLIMTGQSMGIGFLMAAKSILRFSETKDDQQLAEYVLIGTLLSFGLAIVAATLTKMALAL
jgi:hypothetical protein